MNRPALQCHQTLFSRDSFDAILKATGGGVVLETTFVSIGKHAGSRARLPAGYFLSSHWLMSFTHWMPAQQQSMNVVVHERLPTETYVSMSEERQEMTIGKGSRQDGRIV